MHIWLVDSRRKRANHLRYDTHTKSYTPSNSISHADTDSRAYSFTNFGSANTCSNTATNAKTSADCSTNCIPNNRAHWISHTVPDDSHPSPNSDSDSLSYENSHVVTNSLPNNISHAKANA